MYPRYIALKKDNLNYYMIFETIFLGEEGMEVYKIIPKHTSFLNIHSVEHGTNQTFTFNPSLVKRTTRRTPNFINVQCNPQWTGSIINSIISTQRYIIPLISLTIREMNLCIGNRWKDNNPDYLFAIEPTVDEINTIKNYVNFDSYIGNANTNYSIIAFQNRICTRIPFNDSVRNTVPTYIIKGWLENSIRNSVQCPITHEILTQESICSTPCFHILDYTAACNWISEHGTCPVCRTACILDRLYQLILL